MPITTVAVTCTAARPDGSLIAGGKFRFLLSNTDTENGLVVPREISATANAQGVAVANLWPNSLGALGTQYRVLLTDPLGSTIDLGSCTVPISACNLHAILGLGTAPTLDQATVAKLAAQTAAAASSASATQSASSATQAATSTTAAAGSATAAAASQTAAAGSVTSAANSATAAGNSATSAASSNTAAGASATSAASSAADALSSKNAAATSATNAASSATSAQTSATNAATSATTATTKASEAATSSSNAATSATAALASQTAAATFETNAQGLATTAATQAGNAASSATNAASSATNAASSASSAASSAAAVAAVTTGNMSSQDADAVAITGGSVSSTSITVADNVFTLQDNVDPTKQAQFQLSGLATGTTRTYTLPDISSTIAVTTLGQTFSGIQSFIAANGNFVTGATTGTTNLATGAVTTGLLKTVNLGTGGLSGSTTNITVGSANGSTTTMLGSTTIGGVAGSQSLQVNNVASAVNYAQIVGNTTNNAPIISAQGTDTNISLFLLQKGIGTVYIGGNGTIGSLQVATPASMVNSLSIFGNTTGNAVSLSAIGSDTNIAMGIGGKGAGAIQLYSGGNESFRFANLGNSDFTNYFTTSGQLNYTAAGGSSNINFSFGAKGTGSIQLASGGGTQAVVSNTASAVNYLQLTGAGTNAAPTLSAQGSDANINLKLTPKGTGVLQFGTYTAGVLSPTGYITITDAGGTSRRLLVG